MSMTQFRERVMAQWSYTSCWVTEVKKKKHSIFFGVMTQEIKVEKN